jgi:hypothetical protein
MSFSSADRFPGPPPEVNQLVDVWGGWHRWLPSRVEDDADGVLVVSAPTLPGGVRPDPGDRVSLRWLSRRGIGEVNGELVRRSWRPIESWWVRPIGVPMVTQRRRYARATVTIPVSVELDLEPEHEPVHGTTVDIGEGGVHCIARGLDGIVIGEGLHLTLDIDGKRLVAGGQVLRTNPLQNGFRSFVVRFDALDRRDADHIRRFVFMSSVRSLVREPA